MDATTFDRWVRRLSAGASRRRVLGGLLGGLALSLPLEATARKKSKGKGRRWKGKGKGKQRATAQGDGCWRAGACIPKKGANVSRCDLSGATLPANCTGCNLSRVNLRGVTAQGVNFTRANLSGACLVGADFTGATFANNTNLHNAIFCGTRMPDGEINDDGCENGTACCPTCTANAQCAAGQICANGACQTCDVCASGCAFTSIQAAINATTPQLTIIRVCPGTYVENGYIAAGVYIQRPLTLIGAGDGADPATSTILTPALTNRTGVLVRDAGTVWLEGLRLTGGTSGSGWGLEASNSTLTVARCTITGNTSTAGPVEAGGVVIGSAHVTFVNTHVTNNTGFRFGGVLVGGSGASLKLDTLSRVTGNTFTDASGVGGIAATGSAPVELPSVDNVTGNELPNCFGSGITGPGAVCLTT